MSTFPLLSWCFGECGEQVSEDVSSLPIPPMDPTQPIRIRIPEGNPMGLPPTMIVNGAENTKELMSREPKGLDMNLPAASQMIMGTNALPVVVGDQLPKLKEGIAKMFTDQKTVDYIPMVQKHLHNHIEKWLRESDSSKQIVTFNACQNLVIDIILELTMGCDLDDPKYEVMFQAVHDAGAVLTAIPTDDPNSDFQKGLAARRLMDEYMDIKLSENKSESKSGKTLMGMFIEMSRNEDGSIDTDKVKDGIVGMILTSNLSPCGTMTNLINFIGTHPEVKEKIREELKQHGLMDEDKRMTLNLVQKLEYISYCIKETLRMVPVVAVGFRKMLEDQQLGEYRLPKDYHLIYHYAETLAKTNSQLKDGSKFKPERWFSDNITEEATSACPGAMTVKKLMDPKECHFTPFGSGRRACVASEFGKTMVTMFVVELVSRSNWDVINPGRAPLTFNPVGMPDDFVPAIFHRL